MGGHRVFRLAAGLYVSHLVGLILPILEVPILARALGASEYGRVVFLQSIALMCSIFVEYGFNLSATRLLSAGAMTREELGKTFANVSLCKVVLLAAVSFFLLIAWALAGSSALDWVGWRGAVAVLCYVVAFGFSPFWYFQGRQIVGGVVALELVLRVLGLILVWLFVRTNHDGDLALALMAGTGMLNTVLSSLWCLRSSGISAPIWRTSMDMLRDGFHLFMYRGASSMLMSAVPAVLGVVAGPRSVGAFAPAEKVVRGVVGLGAPLISALFPHISSSWRAEERIGLAQKLTIAGGFVAGVFAAVVLSVFGERFLVALLGQSYIGVCKILIWLVWLIPLRIVSQAMTMLVLIPGRRDQVATLSLIVGAMVGIGSGAGLGISYGAVGMAVGLLMGESVLVMLIGREVLKIAKF